MNEEGFGPDDFNAREEEAANWCEQIMVAEGRESLLQQYYGTDEMWLYHRLCEVLDDCLFYNRSSGPMRCFTDLFTFVPGYGTEFYTALDLSDPYFSLGGVILGHMAAHPQYAIVFTSAVKPDTPNPDRRLLTPVHYHAALKLNNKRLPKTGQAAGADTPALTCDWKIANNCDNRKRFVLAFPMGNRVIYYSTCYPCAKELSNKI